MFHLNMVNQPFKVPLKEITSFIQPTRKYHEFYTSDSYIKSMTRPNGTLRLLTPREHAEMNEYMPHEPLHHFIDGLKDTGVYDKLDKDEDIIFMLMNPAERGFIFFFNYDGMNKILKPYQDKKWEKEVIMAASDRGVGPMIFGLGKLWIAEEFIHGVEITSLLDKIPHEDIGMMLGTVYSALHEVDIIYTYPRWIAPVEGPRHVIIDGIRATIIDFGTSRISTKEDKKEQDVAKVMKYFKDNEVINFKRAKKGFNDAYYC